MLVSAPPRQALEGSGHFARGNWLLTGLCFQQFGVDEIQTIRSALREA